MNSLLTRIGLQNIMLKKEENSCKNVAEALKPGTKSFT